MDHTKLFYHRLVRWLVFVRAEDVSQPLQPTFSDVERHIRTQGPWTVLLRDGFSVKRNNILMLVPFVCRITHYLGRQAPYFAPVDD